MPIDFTRLRSVTARQIARAVEADGFQLSRQKGSHRHYKHEDGRRVTLSFHSSGQTFPIGTPRSIVEIQARWDDDDLIRLGLVAR